VDFRKAFDTTPHAVVWQVLEDLGVHEKFLDIIKSLCAHGSAAGRMPHGVFEIFQMPHGNQARVPFDSYTVWPIH